MGGSGIQGEASQNSSLSQLDVHPVSIVAAVQSVQRCGTACPRPVVVITNPPVTANGLCLAVKDKVLGE